MLLTNERVRPWSARCWRSSSGRPTRSSSPSWVTVISSGASSSSEPFGPLTATWLPLIVTSTPDGTGMGFLPILDMVQLPDLTEDLSAHLALARLAVGEQTLVGGQHGDPHATEHARHLVRGGVDPQPRLRHALDPGDGPAAVGGVLEGDRELAPR